MGSCSTKVRSMSHLSLHNHYIQSRTLIYRTHLGSITYLSFPTRSHLLSASDDGTICLYHTRDWGLLATLRGHKGRVNSVAIHSSMKVGLSVGKDRTLRMWDLMRGKGSASIKLGIGEVIAQLSLLRCIEQRSRGRSNPMDTIRDKVCCRVTNIDWYLFNSRYSSESQYIHDFLPLFGQKMALLHTIPHGSRIHDLRFCTRRDGRELLLVAAENKQVSVYLLNEGEPSSSGPLPIVAVLVGHQNRYGHLIFIIA